MLWTQKSHTQPNILHTITALLNKCSNTHCPAIVVVPARSSIWKSCVMWYCSIMQCCSTELMIWVQHHILVCEYLVFLEITADLFCLEFTSPITPWPHLLQTVLCQPLPHRSVGNTTVSTNQGDGRATDHTTACTLTGRDTAATLLCWTIPSNSLVIMYASCHHIFPSATLTNAHASRQVSGGFTLVHAIPWL